jgi:hypothetical protein
MSGTRSTSGSRFGTSTAPSQQASGSRSRSAMKLSQLEKQKNEIEQIHNEMEDFLSQINETKVELNVLMLKTHNYSRNTSWNYKDSVPQTTEGQSLYSRSPFGQKLHISDYSFSVAATAPKKQKRPFL